MPEIRATAAAEDIPGLPPSLASAGRCLVMGVLNVTPDSFSDGGDWIEVDDAIARGVQMVADGADLIDVGGESTRPGAGRIDAEQEARRVLPVIRGLVEAGVVVSVDTLRAGTAAAALEAGAHIVNDVSGGLADPDMARVVAQAGVPFVLMHWRGPSTVMDSLAVYDDVVVDVRDELLRQLDAVVAAGVDERSVILDPGFGFAKNADHNWQLLGRLDELLPTGRPLLIGTGRKRFLAKALRDNDAPAKARDDATAATTVLAAQAGAWAVRVHEVAASAAAVRVVALARQAATTAPEQGRT